MNVREQQRRIISTAELADWIERHPDRLWIVDGDRRLMREVDFPCTSDRLSEALRGHGGPLVVSAAGWIGPEAWDCPLPENHLEDLPPLEGRHTGRTLNLSWSDEDGPPWLLYEYIP